jgi:hypothetical protein
MGNQVIQTMTNNFIDLFSPRPENFGMGGDGFLWDELSSHFTTQALPNSGREVKMALEEAIVKLTSATFDGQDAYFVERYDRGGMSSGYVSRHYWVATGIPLLVSRFRGKAPKTRDYFAELYVAGIFGDEGWAVYFPKRDIGFDFIVSKEVNGTVLLRPVQVKGLYPTPEKLDKDTYGFAGTLSAVHAEMVLAMPFFSATERGAAPACIAYVPLTEMRDRERGGVRCVPCRLVAGAPQPRPSFAKFFDHDGLIALEDPAWSKAQS